MSSRDYRTATTGAGHQADGTSSRIVKLGTSSRIVPYKLVKYD